MSMANILTDLLSVALIKLGEKGVGQKILGLELWF